MSRVQKQNTAELSKVSPQGTKQNEAAGSRREELLSKHQGVQRGIKDLPTSAEEYLLLGDILKEKGDLYGAVNACEQGIRNVAPNDDQYTQLQRGMDGVLATLAINQKSENLEPYDIWNQIFRYLKPRDLLRCAAVSKTWCNFVLPLPELWQQLPDEVAEVTESILRPLEPDQHQLLRFHGYLDRCLMSDIVKIITFWNDMPPLKLVFYKVAILKEEDTDCLIHMLRSMRPSVQVEFQDCVIPSNAVIPLLESCAGLARVSFDRNYVDSQPSSLDSLSLQYLKLSFHASTCTGDGPIRSGHFADIFQNFSNLAHLFMDSARLLHLPECISQALKYCPQLETLVMSDGAVIPISFTQGIDSDKHNQLYNMSDSTTNRASGLRRLVLVSENIKLNQGDIIRAIERSSKTLEFLWLSYGYTIGPDALKALADHGAPKLRSIHFVPNHQYQADVSPRSMDKILAKLFSGCPSLETVAIVATFDTSSSNETTNGQITGDSEVMKAIAEHCPLVSHFRYTGSGYTHTLESLLRFAAIRESSLVYLETDILRRNLLKLVKTIPSLRYVYALNPHNLEVDIVPEEERMVTDRILLDEREGKLVLPKQRIGRSVRGNRRT